MGQEADPLQAGSEINPCDRLWDIFFDHGSYVNAPKNHFLIFELFMYINTVAQVLPPGGFCPNRECFRRRCL